MMTANIAILLAALLVFVTGFYCLVKTRNIIRIIIALEIAMKGVTLLLAFAGYINGKIDLVQTFIITMIVIEVIVAVVAAGIAVSVFRHNDTLDIRELNKLQG